MTVQDIRYQNTLRLLAERKLKLKEFAELLGKSPAQVSAFAGRNPHKKIGEQVAREIEHAFNIPKGSLDFPEAADEKHKALYQAIPIFGTAVAEAANIYRAYQQGREKNVYPEIDRKIIPPGPVGEGAFVLKVQGISMEPEFFENDMVVVDPTLDPVPGCYVVASHARGNTRVLRKLVQDGDDLYLYAINESWPNRITKLDEEWTIDGRARWKISDL